MTKLGFTANEPIRGNRQTGAIGGNQVAQNPPAD